MSFFAWQADLPHQAAAVASVVALLDGHPAPETDAGDDILANATDDLDLATLRANLAAVQAAHNLAHPDAPVPVAPLTLDAGPLPDGLTPREHTCPHVTVEMETGTGKTYVYLRTLRELHRRHGFTRFVVVVPSVAILEGVKKAFADTRAHFDALYGATYFACVPYDGGRAGLVPAFARSPFPTLLVMTQQAFNRASNNLYRAHDRVPGALLPYEWLQRTRPVVVLDEPQNMGSDRARRALRALRPLLVLRYSATHRELPNLVHRLTPLQAYRLGLVKQVQVTGVAELGVAPRASLQLLDVSREPLRARVRALCLNPRGEPHERVLTLSPGADVYAATRLPEHEGLSVRSVRAASEAAPAAMELDGGDDGGRTLHPDDVVAGASDEVWAAQIEETVRRHFERQRQLRPLGVKVLSLFFLDRVASYVGDDARARVLFDAIYTRLAREEPAFAGLTAAEVREAYFARRKGQGDGEPLDDVRADSEEARAAFELILRAKERLLTFPDGRDPGTAVAFLFAHSALREGWDNPNVFQICTLARAVSPLKKRQEIGRGLRLAVDQAGRRVCDADKNVLTVVANESYEAYVRTLQTEYHEAGDSPPPPPTRPGAAVARRRDTLLDRLAPLWERLGERVDYTLDLDTDVLVAACLARLDDPTRTRFPRPTLAVTRGMLVPGERGGRVVTERGDVVVAARPVPDFVARVADETGLTRATVRRILDGVSEARRALLAANPEGWIGAFVRVVRDELHEHLAARVRFHATGARRDDVPALADAFPPELAWVQRVLAPAGGPSLYDALPVELGAPPDGLVVARLPAAFRLPLPRALGDHAPAWAVVRDDGGWLVDPAGAGSAEARRRRALAARYLAALGLGYAELAP